jgi:Fe2+ transport system protein B
MNGEPTGPTGPGAEALIRRVIGIISSARPMPLSTSVMISRDEIVELLEEAVEELPAECREARFLLRERDEVIAKARADAELVISEARSQVAQMVQKTEVVRAAEQRARQLLDDAEAQARRRRHEVDDFCDQRLAQFDAALERIHQTVSSAREKLRPPPVPEPEPASAPESEETLGAAFFDQDQS